MKFPRQCWNTDHSIVLHTAERREKPNHKLSRTGRAFETKQKNRFHEITHLRVRWTAAVWHNRKPAASHLSNYLMLRKNQLPCMRIL